MVNRGPQHCPRFAAHPGRDRLLLPNGEASEIRLEVINLPQAVRSYGGGLLFHCLVTIEGAKMRVPARVESNRFVICERTTVCFSRLYFIIIILSNHAHHPHSNSFLSN
jgi:plexin A